MSGRPSLSVVVATYNRPPLVARLLRQLGSQSLPLSEYEVVVVDDGSEPPVGPALQALALPCAVRVIRIANSGAATARDRGLREAEGTTAVVVDDDMQVPPTFLEAHGREHPAGSRRVVLGRIRPDPELARMPLFERYHASSLDRYVAAVKAGLLAVQGHHLCTGNVSFPRADYLAVGGFDRSLARSEDSELGLRLEKAGLSFRLAEDAYTLHGSDHTSLRTWMRRAFLYGVHDLRISRKHPGVPGANPWRFFTLVHPMSRPLLLLTVTAPALGFVLARAAMAAALAVDVVGLERPAIAGTTLAYGIEYFRGMRSEAGSRRAALSSRPSVR